ncbi:NB-ARC domain protein [Leptolyngbyaceae cyanobacterium JSC-12]|nr:NB-ARC domain protein [Leptolyngbyaceae cyanobacterium JSC-12]
MNVEEACRAADNAVFARAGQHLSDVQMLILQGSLQGLTYEQIAQNSHYSVSYIKKFAGPALWSLLSEGLGEPVSKTNFQAALARAKREISLQAAHFQPRTDPVSNPTGRYSAQPVLSRLVGVPHVSVFFGRTQEFDVLQQWIVGDSQGTGKSGCCSLMLLSGLGGIGKTALVTKFARQLQSPFEVIVWQSLNNALPFADVIATLLKGLIGEEIELASNANGRMVQLLEYLRGHRCLLVLDNVEGILQSGELVGQYRQGFQSFGEFFRRIAEDEHQGCLVLIGREQPSEIASLAGDTLPVRALRLKGLLPTDARQLLEAKGVNSSQAGIEELIQLKRGNPLALQFIATTIQDLFDGNVAQLLKQSTVIIGDSLLSLLDEQFERLSALERDVMFWLALEKQSLDKLKENARFIVSSSSELLKTLQSLKRRSLLEEEVCDRTGEPLFTLQPVVLRYSLRKLAEQTLDDILNTIQTQSLQSLGLLRSHALFSDDRLYNHRQTHAYLMTQLLVNNLQTTLGDRTEINQRFNHLLLTLHQRATQAIGYATINLTNLQRITESQLL